MDELENKENSEEPVAAEAPAPSSFEAAFEKAFAEQETKAEPAEKETTDQADGAGEAQAQTPISLEPLHHWPEDVKGKFKTLPVELQQFMLDRHKETDSTFHSKSQELAKARARYSELDEVMEEHADVLATVGRTAPQLVAESIQLHQFAARNPVGFAQWFCERNGINLGQLQQQQTTQRAQIDPQTAAIQAKLEELDSWKSEREQREAQAEQLRQQQEIQSWAHEKSADGKALRPHVEAVIGLMKPIIMSLREANPDAPDRQILQDAYERAIYADPNIRTQIINEERMAKVRAAKTAGSSIAPSSRGAPAAPRSFEDSFERAWAEQNR